MSSYEEVHVSCLAAPEAPLRLALERGSLDELARSIRSLGVLQPLLVRRVSHGLEVIAGHRRLLACRMIALERVPVVIVDPEGEAIELMKLSENVQRADLSPVEEAHACRKMTQVMGLSIGECADRMGKSDAWVRKRIELLSWPSYALTAVGEQRATVNALAPLMEIEDRQERDRLLHVAIESGANGTVTRSWAASVAGEAAAAPEGMRSGSQAKLDLAQYVVHMPCFSCRQIQPALDLRVVRICDPCLDALGEPPPGVVPGPAAVGEERPAGGALPRATPPPVV